MRIQIRPVVLAVIMPLVIAGCMSTEEQVRILRQYDAISAAPSSTPDYDYAVMIKNLKPLGVSTGVKSDRERLAVAYLGDRCPAGKIVSETELATNTPGLGAQSKDYAVRLKC